MPDDRMDFSERRVSVKPLRGRTKSEEDAALDLGGNALALSIRQKDEFVLVSSDSNKPDLNVSC